jgi:hypothetical protein
VFSPITTEAEGRKPAGALPDRSVKVIVAAIAGPARRLRARQKVFATNFLIMGFLPM